MSAYFAIDRRAVLNFFNPFRSGEIISNYLRTVFSLRDGDQHCVGCYRAIYLVLLFESIFQPYLYLYRSQWHRLVFFDIIDESNNYPNIFRLHFSGYALMSAYLDYMLHFRVWRETFLNLFNEYYVNGSKAFVSTSVGRMQHLVLTILNAYQVFTLITVVYLGTEYTLSTLQVVRRDSPWVELVSMNIFFVPMASASLLFVFISYTFLGIAVLCFQFIFLRFGETYRPLSLSYCRFTTTRLLRFVHRNVGTMQYIFSLNRIYGPMLCAFLLVNISSNVMIGICLLQSRFPPKQTVIMFACFVVQLGYFFGVHFVAAVFSKKIHSPYKRIQSLNLLIRRCPLRARIRLANTIQAFHVSSHKYGITYGAGKWTLGLVTMVSFTKFILLYGELLMYQYTHMLPFRTFEDST